MAARKKLKSNRKSSKARVRSPRTRRNYPENARIKWIAEHKRRPTSMIGKAFKKFKSGMTIAQCINADRYARSWLRIGEDTGVLKITTR